MTGGTDRLTLRCLRVTRALQSYLDGVADEKTTQRVAEHLEDCRRCGLEATTYQAIKQSLAQRQQPTDDAVQRLHAFGEELLAGCHDPPQ